MYAEFSVRIAVSPLHPHSRCLSKPAVCVGDLEALCVELSCEDAVSAMICSCLSRRLRANGFVFADLTVDGNRYFPGFRLEKVGL